MSTPRIRKPSKKMRAAGYESPSSVAAAVYGESSSTAAVTTPPSAKASSHASSSNSITDMPTSLYTAEDNDAVERGDLSPAHCFLRKELVCIEYEPFCVVSDSEESSSDEADTDEYNPSSSQPTSYHACVHCKFCAERFLKPSSLAADKFYGYIVRRVANHILECPKLPPKHANKYNALRCENTKRGRKDYWEYSANRIGLVSATSPNLHVTYDPTMALASAGRFDRWSDLEPIVPVSERVVSSSSSSLLPPKPISVTRIRTVSTTGNPNGSSNKRRRSGSLVKKSAAASAPAPPVPPKPVILDENEPPRDGGPLIVRVKVVELGLAGSGAIIAKAVGYKTKTKSENVE